MSVEVVRKLVDAGSC